MSKYLLTVQDRPHTIGKSGTHYDPALSGFNGGLQTGTQQPEVHGDHMHTPDLQSYDSHYVVDQAGIVRGTNDWHDIHSYTNKKPTFNVGRLENLK